MIDNFRRSKELFRNRKKKLNNKTKYKIDLKDEIPRLKNIKQKLYIGDVPNCERERY